MLAPSGRIVAVDLAPQMVAVASAGAAARALDAIEFAVMDAEGLQFAEGTFDACMNGYGLMFCTDPERAIVEARRVVRAGGAVVAIVWDEPSKNPFFTTLRHAAADVLKLPDPGPARHLALCRRAK